MLGEVGQGIIAAKAGLLQCLSVVFMPRSGAGDPGGMAPGRRRHCARALPLQCPATRSSSHARRRPIATLSSGSARRAIRASKVGFTRNSSVSRTITPLKQVTTPILVEYHLSSSVREYPLMRAHDLWGHGVLLRRTLPDAASRCRDTAGRCVRREDHSPSSPSFARR